ncbi:SDR family NAD(P)-dependent oxidoreductase [Nocardiopsis alba]|uniref:SDR family NAD(P)-dependent oxidoreductase n=1 Tax=Nocardiopsis alba TaxID=53437 RepID=UPI003F4D6DBE
MSEERRSVLVTGGTRGIGAGIARAFARAGDRVVITGRDEERAREAAGNLPGVEWAVGDVSRAADCARIVEEVVERTGGLDVLCTNAGVFPSSPLATMTEAELDEVIGTNLKGTMLMVRAAMEALAASDQGRVVITSSITGPLTGYAGWSHYGATKAAQLGFMRSAALELAPRGVTVNAVMPGNVRTEGLAELGGGVPGAYAFGGASGAVGRGGGYRPGLPVPGRSGGLLHHRSGAGRGRRPGAARRARGPGRSVATVPAAQAGRS